MLLNHKQGQWAEEEPVIKQDFIFLWRFPNSEIFFDYIIENISGKKTISHISIFHGVNDFPERVGGGRAPEEKEFMEFKNAIFVFNKSPAGRLHVPHAF